MRGAKVSFEFMFDSKGLQKLNLNSLYDSDCDILVKVRLGK